MVSKTQKKHSLPTYTANVDMIFPLFYVRCSIVVVSGGGGQKQPKIWTSFIDITWPKWLLPGLLKPYP